MRVSSRHKTSNIFCFSTNLKVTVRTRKLLDMSRYVQYKRQPPPPKKSNALFPCFGLAIIHYKDLMSKKFKSASLEILMFLLFNEHYIEQVQILRSLIFRFIRFRKNNRLNYIFNILTHYVRFNSTVYLDHNKAIIWSILPSITFWYLLKYEFTTNMV